MNRAYTGKGSRYKTYLSDGEQQACFVFLVIYVGWMLSFLLKEWTPHLVKAALQYYEYLLKISQNF